MNTYKIDTTPITNSACNKHRQFAKGIEINYEYLKKYLHFGQLVDAMITEPDKIDFENRILHNITRYENQKYQYGEYDFQLALRMKEAFFLDPLARSLVHLSDKYVFNNKEFEFKVDSETTWLLPTEGELDLVNIPVSIGGDVKMTTATTQEEFNKKVVELHYDQQGASYMDNTGINKFVIIGISRKRKQKGGVDHRTGRQKVFHYTMERGDQRYKNGINRYNHWVKELVNHRLENKEATIVKINQESSGLPFFMQAG